MRAALTAPLLFLLTLNQLVSAIPPQETPPGGNNFQLNIWRNSRYSPPPISGYPEISSPAEPSTIVNRTVDYPGFHTSIQSGPTIANTGKLYRSVGKKLFAFLKPISTEGHYHLLWEKEVPKKPAGILSSNFTTLPINCGRACGGTGLVYNFLSDGVDLSGWFVTPKVGEEGVWELGWTKDSTTYPRPANSYVVYVWAKAV